MPFPPPADFNLQSYIDTQMPRVSAVDPICEEVIRYVREDLGVERIGGVGYCFGGKYVCRWLREGGLDAGFVAHPSFVEWEEVGGVEGPLSIAAARKFFFTCIHFCHYYVRGSMTFNNCDRGGCYFHGRQAPRDRRDTV